VVAITKLAGILRNKKTSLPLYIGRTQPEVLTYFQAIKERTKTF
jgi:hypothetical protein